MDVDNTRKSTSSSNGIVAGSVWESRIKQGGFTLFSEETPDENGEKDCTFTNGNSNNQVDKKLEIGQKPNLGVGVSGKRKTWKAENFEGNPIQIARKRSELSKNLDEKCKDLSISKKSSEFRKMKSESLNGNSKSSDGVVKKSNFESSENLEGLTKESEKKPNGIKKTKSEENCKDFGIYEEKFITSKVVKNLENEEEEWDEVLEEEIEKESVDVKEIKIQEQKSKKIVIEEKKFNQSNKRLIPISSVNKKQLPPNSGHVRIHPSPTRTKSVSDEFQRFPRQHSKLQSLFDLIMWKCVPKSALVFGIGTFVIISSSFTQDLNISFISVLSYLGLVYLAGIFLFRSLIQRGTTDISDSSEYVLGEEEAQCVLKWILPFINEFLLKVRALFTGDPATTMKMAVILFVLAKYGSFITIWKLSKLGFFGVFIIPKICSSYYTQLTSYGTFWIQYIRDTWGSYTHKKAVGFVIFTIVWNFSSVVARIWAVFMLYVGFRYYQQTLMSEGCGEEEKTTTKSDDSLQEKIQGQRQVGRKSSLMETRKQKKPF